MPPPIITGCGCCTTTVRGCVFAICTCICCWLMICCLSSWNRNKHEHIYPRRRRGSKRPAKGGDGLLCDLLLLLLDDALLLALHGAAVQLLPGGGRGNRWCGGRGNSRRHRCRRNGGSRRRGVDADFHPPSCVLRARDLHHVATVRCNRVNARMRTCCDR